MLEKSPLALAVALLFVVSGCSGLTTPATTTPQQTPTPTPSTTAPVTTPTTTSTTRYTLTDRTPAVWLELFPNPGFTGHIQVLQSGEEVFNQSFSDYAGFGEFTLTTNDSKTTSHTVTAIVNGTVDWKRRIGSTESYELTIHQNGTVEVRSHAIR